MKWDEIRTIPKQNPWQSLYVAGTGSNSPTSIQDPNPQTTQKIQNKFNKYIGPVTSVLSPLEVGIDALIRKDGNTFGQKIKNSFSQGSDIGGALTTRGMNPALAIPLGFIGSILTPGLGELGQVKHLSKVDDLGKALNKIDDLPSLKKVAFNQDSYNALRKFYNLDSKAVIPDELIDSWKVIDDFKQKTGAIPKLADDGTSWIFKEGGENLNVPPQVKEALEKVLYRKPTNTIYEPTLKEINKFKELPHLSDTHSMSRPYEDVIGSFQEEVSKWTKGVEPEGKLNAYQLASDNWQLRRKLLKEQFGDWKGTTTVYRVGEPTDEITSVFPNKEIAESYAKRMGIENVNEFKATIDDLVPSQSGSGELFVNKNSLIQSQPIKTGGGVILKDTTNYKNNIDNLISKAKEEYEFNPGTNNFSRKSEGKNQFISNFKGMVTGTKNIPEQTKMELSKGVGFDVGDNTYLLDTIGVDNKSNITRGSGLYRDLFLKEIKNNNRVVTTPFTPEGREFFEKLVKDGYLKPETDYSMGQLYTISGKYNKTKNFLNSFSITDKTKKYKGLMDLGEIYDNAIRGKVGEKEIYKNFGVSTLQDTQPIKTGEVKLLFDKWVKDYDVSSLKKGLEIVEQNPKLREESIKNLPNRLTVYKAIQEGSDTPSWTIDKGLAERWAENGGRELESMKISKSDIGYYLGGPESELFLKNASKEIFNIPNLLKK